MKKFQKVCLIISIIFSINYALHILLDFNVIYNYIHGQPWLERCYAFFFGVCAFINILLLKKEEF